MTLVVLAVALGALAQSISGIGFTLVSGPLLVASLGPTDGVRLSVLLSLVVNVVVLTRTRRQACVRDALLLLVPAVVATPLLARLVRGVPARTAELLAGSAVVLGAALLAAGVRWRAAGGRAGAIGAGVLSAAMNVVAGVGGPAIALHATNADWPATAMRSTGQVYFLGLNVVAAITLGFPTVAGVLVVGCLLALTAGLLAGARLAPLVPAARARQVTLSLAALGGLVVLVQAV